MIFFTPCLLFTNIASVITFNKLVTLWPIPAFFALFLIISWVVGQVTFRLFGIQGAYRRFVLACSLFSNTNSLPLAIINSLAFSEAGRLLYWRTDDTQQQVAARGTAYVLFYAMFCNIIRWSYGYHLLQPQPLDQMEDDDIDSDNGDQQPYSPYSSTSTPTLQTYNATDDKLDYGSKCVSPSSSILTPSFPNESSTLLPSSLHQPMIHPWWKRAVFKLHSYMSPPLYAAVLALVVGLSPLHPLLFDEHAFLYPSVTKAIQSCGKVAVPLILICLGSQLTWIAQQEQSSWSSPVVASLVTRMVVPIIVIGTVVICLWHDTHIDLLQDPMFVVSLIILGCTPTAINLSQITQVSGMFEHEMMQVLFWNYGVICIPLMTMVVFVALAVVDNYM
ncbi:auxin efflux carrier [Chlamydoabsidia padenii]|nr:auxin efflux carrier [Chlamydoabsidia padenii]